MAAIVRLHPQLIFLDVRMPGRGGFDVIKGLGPGPAPHVVFVTAYGDYAVEAFEVEARGAIVNLRRVREIHPGVGDEPTVVLADGTKLPLSRRYRARLRARGVPV